VVLAAITSNRTLAQLAEQFDVHPDQITTWKAQLEDGRPMFSVLAVANCRGREGAARQDWRTYIGKRFFRRSPQQGGVAELKAMIDRKHNLPISKQAEALNISRCSVYYLPRPVPKTELAVMHRLDRLHLEYPLAGSRMLRGLLAAGVQDRPSAGKNADGAHGERCNARGRLMPKLHRATGFPYISYILPCRLNSFTRRAYGQGN
jgi:putative transposase